MFSATTYAIRPATPADDVALRRLAGLDSQSRLAAGPVLVGEFDGAPQAAISLVDGRTIANPFAPTAGLLAHLRIRAVAMHAQQRTPSLPERIRAALAGGVIARPIGAGA
jgi:hypothetical protein